MSPRRQTAHERAEKKDQRIKITGARTLLHTLTTYTAVEKFSILSTLLGKRKQNIAASRKIQNYDLEWNLLQIRFDFQCHSGLLSADS